MWIFWDYWEWEQVRSLTLRPAGAAPYWGTWMSSTVSAATSKLLSGTDLCFNTSSKLTLGWSFWVFNQACGKKLTPDKMGAHFLLNLFRWDWRSEILTSLFQSIQPSQITKEVQGEQEFILYERIWVFEVHLEPVSPHFPSCITEPSPALWGINNPTLQYYLLLRSQQGL